MPDTKVMDITDLAVANASRKAVMSVVKKYLSISIRSFKCF